MYVRVPAIIGLRIGDALMSTETVIVEIDAKDTCKLRAVLVRSIDGKRLRIERDGIPEPSGLRLQSPLAQAYWTAAQAHLDEYPFATAIHVARFLAAANDHGTRVAP